ncbi:EF-P 5-aminopentanol modification-associated protein YfmF [Alteribacillus sp. HJP-4]|uniref:EF-P 5-aminopentanol modification-associated protein YfmF n=1 Tax=Alteribacillus sp. HJP-4 TaxID=2775394 RepID=UPI0035CD11D7
MHNEKIITDLPFPIHLISTKKYKTTTLVLQLKTKLSHENAAPRALLANVLKSGTAGLPTRKKIRLFLDELYGASFSNDISKKGENHVISFRMETANEKYLQEDPSLFEKSISFLRDILEKPLIEENTFSKKIVEEEKRNLIQKIGSIYDDKIRYANVRMLEIMCQGEPFGVHPYGKTEEVKALSTADLYQEYQQMLADDDIRLYIVGDITEEQVRKQADLFQVKSSAADTPPETVNDKVQTGENHVTETDDVQQGKLHIGYRTPVTFENEKFPAMQVMNGLFGGFPHSKLFINVREKESLAYYAASRYESQKGLVFVMSGIEAGKYDRAVTIIKEQLEDMRKGEFTEEEVEQTKRMLKNQLLETADSARGMVELSYQGVVSRKNRPLAEWIQQIDEVKKEDIISCAEELNLDTIYFLCGKEERN